MRNFVKEFKENVLGCKECRGAKWIVMWKTNIDDLVRDEEVLK